MQLKVYYEDTDAGGVVYYANYLKYFERARTEYLLNLGIDILYYIRKNILFTVVKVMVDYKSPARYGDLLEVGTELITLSKASFELRNIVKNAKNGNLLVCGVVEMACLNEKGKPGRLPEEFAAKLSKYCKSN